MNSAEQAPAAGVNLSNCDREPIHIPGSVQGHGCMLVLALESVGGPDGLDDAAISHLVVDRASENASGYLGLPLGQILGAPASRLFSSDIEQELRAEFENKREERANHFLRSVKLGTGITVEIITHTQGHNLVVELERLDLAIDQNVLNTTIVNVVAQLESIKDIAGLGRAITREIRTLTGFDRILLYSFDEPGNGTVIAEDRNENLPSMLHLRFPATDIPQQARSLYLLNRIRIIPDVDYTPSVVGPAALTMPLST